MLLSLCQITQPLHQVIGYSDILELTTLSEVQLDSVKSIQRSTESLMAIINDLLDLSAYEENGVKVSNIGFSLRGLLKGCLAAVEPGASMKQLTLNLDIPSNVPKVAGKKCRQIQQKRRNGFFSCLSDSTARSDAVASFGSSRYWHWH